MVTPSRKQKADRRPALPWRVFDICRGDISRQQISSKTLDDICFLLQAESRKQISRPLLPVNLEGQRKQKAA